MKEINVCPSTLAEGFDTYSPAARKVLFDGKMVSPRLSVPSPSVDSLEAKEAIKNIGRISLSGVQPKFAVVLDENNQLCYARNEERGTYILKPQPNGYHLLNKEYCAANEHLTMQIARQAYGIETAANALCFFANDEAAYITRRFDIHADGKYQQEDFAALMGYTKANGGSDYKRTFQRGNAPHRHASSEQSRFRGIRLPHRTSHASGKTGDRSVRTRKSFG